MCIIIINNNFFFKSYIYKLLRITKYAKSLLGVCVHIIIF